MSTAHSTFSGRYTPIRYDVIFHRFVIIFVIIFLSVLIANHQFCRWVFQSFYDSFIFKNYAFSLSTAKRSWNLKLNGKSVTQITYCSDTLNDKKIQKRRGMRKLLRQIIQAPHDLSNSSNHYTLREHRVSVHPDKLLNCIIFSSLTSL